MDILKLMRDAGLTADEMARLCEVTKPTIYNWGSGKPPRSQAVFNRAMKICGLLQKAVDTRLLPLSADVERTDRSRKVSSILAEIYRSA